MHAKRQLKSGGKKRRNNLKTVGNRMVNTISLLSSLLFSLILGVLNFGGPGEKTVRPQNFLPPPLPTILIIHFLST